MSWLQEASEWDSNILTNLLVGIWVFWAVSCLGVGCGVLWKG